MNHTYARVVIKLGSDLKGENQSNKVQVSLNIEGASIPVATFILSSRAKQYAKMLSAEYGNCGIDDLIPAKKEVSE